MDNHAIALKFHLFVGIVRSLLRLEPHMHGTQNNPRATPKLAHETTNGKILC